MKNTYQLKEHSNRLGLRKETLRVFYRDVVMDKMENGKLVIQTVSPEDECQADILQETRYYPFGMLMDFGDSGVYRFGFNGKENDTEWGEWLSI